MEFSIKTGNLENPRSDCLIIGMYEGAKLSEDGVALDQISEGYISNILKRGDIDGKLASSLVLHNVPGVAAERVLLVGLGKAAEFAEKQYCQAVRVSIKALSNTKANDVITYLANLPVKKLSTRWKTAHLTEVALDASYKFDAIKSKKEASKEAAKKGIFKLTIHVAQHADVKEAEYGIADGKALAKGVSLAKDLGNLPPNICTPTYLADEAVVMGKKYDFKVKVLEKDELKKLGMGSFLGIT
ncbi:MAG: leucyl aminopeptidase, partial [Methylotenera sp.]|nr:leucyl aminopeptidase [Methylotenera sp.]